MFAEFLLFIFKWCVGEYKVICVQKEGGKNTNFNRILTYFWFWGFYVIIFINLVDFIKGGMEIIKFYG